MTLRNSAVKFLPQRSPCKAQCFTEFFGFTQQQSSLKLAHPQILSAKSKSHDLTVKHPDLSAGWLKRICGSAVPTASRVTKKGQSALSVEKSTFFSKKVDVRVNFGNLGCICLCGRSGFLG